jgi:MFS family permease
MALLLSVHYTGWIDGFGIFIGALLGFCAALLWTAQGCIMVSYPHEDDKGKFFGWFWAIFNMGAVIGSLVSPHLCIFRTANLVPPHFRPFRQAWFLSTNTSFEVLLTATP